LATPSDVGRLSACALIIVNPPWTLEGELRTILPQLVGALAQSNGARHSLHWLAPEN
ncbi:MAG: 23S rRNA (adenine(2030)-N(6))-methyltransferase RlmJ, partial [Alphaproteobacteria bacterium]